MKRFLSALLLLSTLCTPVLAAKTVFIDGVAATKTPGTKVSAAFLNGVNNHRHSGANSDGAGVLDYVIATGSNNALTITLSPAITGHVAGMPITVKCPSANSGSVTIAVNGLTPIAITKRGATPLVAGDIAEGQLIVIAWDGTQYQLVGHEPSPVTDVTTLSGQTAAMLTPPGTVITYAAPTVPNGWLACNGAAVSRITYSALFTAIGTTWGAGDTSTTFNVPDLRGEFIRGWDNGRGIDLGRDFASAQAGSIVFADNAENAVWTPSIAGSQSGLADPAPAAAAFGYDIPYFGEFDGAGITSSGSFTNKTITGPLGRVYDSNATRAFVGVSRPRNRALFYLIKN